MVDKKQLQRKFIPLNDKIQILNRLQDGERVSSVARSLNLHEATIRTIKKNENKVRKSVVEGCLLSAKHVSCAGDTVEMNNAIPAIYEEYNHTINSHSDDKNGVDMNIQDVKEHSTLKFEQPKLTLDTTNTEKRMEKEIDEIRENILKKYKTLKAEKIDEDIKGERQYKPISKPLKRIAVKTSNIENESNRNTVKLHEVNKYDKRKLVSEQNAKNLRKRKPMSTIPYQLYEKSARMAIKNSPYLENEDSDESTSEYSDDTTSEIENQQESIQTLQNCRNNNNFYFDYTHWDDPNELVDRLRLLETSRQAGNNNHDKEIHYIIKELREADYIE